MGAVAASTCFSGEEVLKPRPVGRGESEPVTSLSSPSDTSIRKLTMGELPGIVEEDGDNHVPQLLPNARSKRSKASKGLSKTRSQYHVSPRIC